MTDREIEDVAVAALVNVASDQTWAPQTRVQAAQALIDHLRNKSWGLASSASSAATEASNG